MNAKDSRFPKLFSFVRSHPNLLYSIPQKVYSKMYGSYNNSLPCPFWTDKIFANLKQIETVYNMLYDYESKMTFLNVILYRLTLNRDFILRANRATILYRAVSFAWK